MSGIDNQEKQSSDPYIFDGFLIKEFLEAVKEGNQQKIQSYIEKYSLDLKYIKDFKPSYKLLSNIDFHKYKLLRLEIVKNKGYFVESGLTAKI